MNFGRATWKAELGGTSLDLWRVNAPPDGVERCGRPLYFAIVERKNMLLCGLPVSSDRDNSLSLIENM